MISLNVISSGSKGNAYILSVGIDCLLIEAGICYNKILKANNYTLNNILDCLISHKHNDHSKSMADIVESGVVVWTNLETASLYPYSIRVVEYEKKLTLANKNYSIYAVKGNHDVELTIFQIIHNSGKSFVFATDTSELPLDFCVDYYFVECNFDEDTLNQNTQNGNVNVGFVNSRVVSTHLSLEYLIKYFSDLQDNNIKGIVLLHKSGNNANLTAFNKLQNIVNCPVFIAENGKKIILEE